MSMNKTKPLTKPVCTLSPMCSSDIFTSLVSCRFTLAVDGRQPPPLPDGAHVVVGGGVGGGGTESCVEDL